MINEQTTPIRQLMPKGFLSLIASKTGCSRPNISNCVNDENIRSQKIWWAIEELARLTDPERAEKRIAYLKEKHHII
jgi:hypothetical protein